MSNMKVYFYIIPWVEPSLLLMSPLFVVNFTADNRLYSGLTSALSSMVSCDLVTPIKGY